MAGQAAVEVADESVAECAEGLVVGVADGAVLVVELACAGAGANGAERPQVDRLGQALVAGVAGQYDTFGA